MLALIAVIVGMVILIKSQKRRDQASPETTEPPKVLLNEVLPPSQPVSEPAPAAVPEPAMESPVVEPLAPAPVVAPIQEGVPVTETVAENAIVAGAVVATEEPNAVQNNALGDAVNKTGPEAEQLIKKALKLRDSGKVIAARDLLNESLNMKLSPAVRTGVKAQMAKLSEDWLFGRGVLEGDKMTSHYLVQPGDLLLKISKQHKVPYDILLKINGMERPESLQAGQRIKVIDGAFNAVINRTTYTMDIYLQNVYVKSYKVGLGRSEHTTPTGRWVVASGGKMIKPTWTDPDTGKTYLGSDPDYPLGSRWIALDGIEGNAKGRTGFAIHGTKDPETIGTQSSRGCIRLFNGDVIEVYDLMEPGQSSVIVMD
jgi:LysM repeat protein